MPCGSPIYIKQTRKWAEGKSEITLVRAFNCGKRRESIRTREVDPVRSLGGGGFRDGGRSPRDGDAEELRELGRFLLTLGKINILFGKEHSPSLLFAFVERNRCGVLALHISRIFKLKVHKERISLFSTGNPPPPFPSPRTVFAFFRRRGLSNPGRSRTICNPEKGLRARRRREEGGGGKRNYGK